MKKLLAYRIRGEKRKLLKSICAAFEISFSLVSPAEYGESVGALAGLPGMKKQGRVCTGAGVGGEMLVFCGLDDALLDEFLDACRHRGMEPVACKAVLTPHNAPWSSEKLYEQLLREQREFSS